VTQEVRSWGAQVITSSVARGYGGQELRQRLREFRPQELKSLGLRELRFRGHGVQESKIKTEELSAQEINNSSFSSSGNYEIETS
jgi:hypothetical protein